jgi:hypothetical protein
VCNAAGLGRAVLWVYWALAAAQRQHPGRHWLLAFMALIHASMLFEVLDFAPCGLRWMLMPAGTSTTCCLRTFGTSL